MHKDIPVLEAPYSTSSHTFTKEPVILNDRHVPLGIRKDGGVSLNRLNYWWVWRGIPDYRVSLDRLLKNLDVDNQQILLDKEYGLSVSDHYWLKPAKEEAGYSELSFFRRSFDQDGFARAMFSNAPYDAPESARHTPNNTLAGYQQKAWFHRRDGLVLLKGGTPFYQQEPVNEWLASKIASRLGIICVPYVTEVYENRLVSVCPNMMDEHTELVPASDLLRYLDPAKDEFQLNPYLTYLYEIGIRDAEKRIEDMLVLDYLMMNSDRHPQNLGFLIDADTMEPKGIAPVFDTGTGLGCLVRDKELEGIQDIPNAQLFNARKIPYEKLLDMVSDLSRYHFENLNGLEEDYGEMLKKYQRISSITDRRIELLKNLLADRIRKIKEQVH